ncbi:hypothetical protein VNO77_08350 [Canavalia gladiata]|uniref:Uncharacterized protein n=1 Tax=Canavalia gladiata TaxID=3824 RepID=A0AAN9MF34_CANGL
MWIRNMMWHLGSHPHSVPTLNKCPLRGGGFEKAPYFQTLSTIESVLPQISSLSRLVSGVLAKPIRIWNCGSFVPWKLRIPQNPKCVPNSGLDLRK